MKINQLKNSPRFPSGLGLSETNGEAGKKILILGFGLEGLSSLKFLRRNFKNTKITIADKKELKKFDTKYQTALKKDKNLNLSLGKNYLKNLDKFSASGGDVIIKAPGIKLENKLIKKLNKKGVVITSNLNIFLANTKGKIIGITGSKGKSTSANLIYKILNVGARHGVFLIGNIGKPALDYINRDSIKTIFVIEMSSYQLDTIDQKKINIALITSFFPEHLDYHGNLNKYFQAKMNIIKNLKPNGIVVYNKNNKKIENFIKKSRIKNIGYSVGTYRDTPNGWLHSPEANIFGHHNLENITGAIQVAKLLKIKNNDIKKAIKNFKGLPHRLQFIGKFKKINFYDDCLSTTPESTIAAIDALKNQNLETIIVGGFDRGLNYKNLAKKIIQTKIKNVICWPNSGIAIYNVILNKVSQRKRANEVEGSRENQSVHFKPNLIKVKNMKQTIKVCYKHTNKNATVLLSPASSSYDFYKNFQEKGGEFKKIIKKTNKKLTTHNKEYRKND